MNRNISQPARNLLSTTVGSSTGAVSSISIVPDRFSSLTSRMVSTGTTNTMAMAGSRLKKYICTTGSMSGYLSSWATQSELKKRAKETQAMTVKPKRRR